MVLCRSDGFASSDHGLQQFAAGRTLDFSRADQGCQLSVVGSQV